MKSRDVTCTVFTDVQHASTSSKYQAYSSIRREEFNLQSENLWSWAFDSICCTTVFTEQPPHVNNQPWFTAPCRIHDARTRVTMCLEDVCVCISRRALITVAVWTPVSYRGSDNEKLSVCWDMTRHLPERTNSPHIETHSVTPPRCRAAVCTNMTRVFSFPQKLVWKICSLQRGGNSRNVWDSGISQRAPSARSIVREHH